MGNSFKPIHITKQDSSHEEAQTPSVWIGLSLLSFIVALIAAVEYVAFLLSDNIVIKQELPAVAKMGIIALSLGIIFAVIGKTAYSGVLDDPSMSLQDWQRGIDRRTYQRCWGCAIGFMPGALFCFIINEEELALLFGIVMAAFAFVGLIYWLKVTHSYN